MNPDLITIGREIRKSTTVQELRFLLVNRSFRPLAAGLVAFAEPVSDGREMIITAVSGAAQVNRESEVVLWLNRVAGMLRQREDKGVQTILRVEADASVAEDWPAWMPDCLVWCPLRDPKQHVQAAALVAVGCNSAAVVEAATEIADVAGHAWWALAALRGRNRHSAPGIGLRGFLRRRRLILLLGSVIVVLLLPVSETVLVPAKVVPRDPMVITAPMDGIIEQLLVEPNQLVQPGVLLMRFDETALQNRADKALKALAVAEAALLRSRQLSFTDPTSKAAIPQLEAEVALHRADLDHVSNLLKRGRPTAPRGGIALFDNPNDWRGRPVAAGERIMVIADPNDAEIEALLPAGEVMVPTIGMSVVLYLNSAPLSALEARVRSIGYEAEPVPEGFLAHKVRASFGMPGLRPRIGLMGTAKLVGGRSTLFYVLFRRPLAWLRQTVGY